MRKSKNYYKFMEYMAFGISGWHENAVMVDNGVIECVAYAKVEHIEDYSKLYECNYDKMAMDSDNTWLTIKCVLVNEEVINVYYVTNERNRYIGQLILDDYRTQKQALDAIHKKVVCFFLNSREFCEFHATEEEPTETIHHDEIDTYQPHIYIDTDNIKYLMETHSFPSTANTRHSYKEVDKVCGDCSHFNACMQGNQTVAPTCCMFDSLYMARKNPNWHHVSLATLANIDNDMLDEKRQNYMYLRILLKDFRKYAFNIKKCDVYFDMVSHVIRDVQQMWFNNTISFTAYEYVMRHLQVVSVEKGYFDARRESVFGFKETRRYKVTLR